MPDDTAAEPSRAVAALRRELAAARAERDEALARETAMAEVLQVINASPGDLAPVFDAILQKALALCEAAFGFLLIYEGEAFRAVAMRDLPPAAAEFLREPVRMVSRGAFHPLIEGDPFVHIPDITDDEIYRSGNRARRVLADEGGARTALWVALRREDALLGTFVIYRKEVRPFTDKQIALLQNFAAQAVIAMENARLLTETREALEQQTATAEVLGVINSSSGTLTPVFDAMVEKAMRLCGGFFGGLQTYDGEVFVTVAARGDVLPIGTTVRPQPGFVLERLVRGQDLVHITNVFEDPAYHASEAFDRMVEAGVRSLLVVALRQDDTLLGAIGIYGDEARPFTDKQIALLQNFAAQAVIAIENARLLTETREALEQQTATAEVLGVINSSPDELAPVFDAIVEKAVRFCGAAYGRVSTYVGESFHLVGLRDAPRVIEQEEPIPPALPPSAGLAWPRLVAGELVVHIADITDTDEYRAGHRGAHNLADIRGYRTLLGMPLRRDDTLLGAIVVYRQEVRPFTDKQIALLQNFAAQAVIAMENARLLTETREALEQQTATAEVLQVINSSPGDLAPVFDAILEKALCLCEASFGTLFTRDGEVGRLVAWRNVPEAFADYLTRDPMKLRTILGPSFRDGPVVHIEDLAASAPYRDRIPLAVAAVELGGIRGLLVVPLMKDDALIGLFAIYRHDPRPFSDKQIALLQNFAAQAVIAMENARLLTETREALEQQTATAEVLQVINSSPGDLAPVFGAMLEKALRLCGAAYGNLLSADGEQFRIIAAVHGDGRVAEDQRNRPPFRVTPDNLLYPLVAGEAITYCADVRQNVAYRESGPRAEAFREMIDSGGYQSILNVGLRKEGSLVGVIGIFRQEVRPFTDKQIALLQNFAAQAVIAIENARLLGELRQRNDEIAGWNRELEDRVAAQLGELERVGKLKRFLAPQLAELIVARGDEAVLETHRRDIVVVFCDLRDFTAFAETAEPEEVLDLLREYHAALGPIVSASEGTLDHFSGDGIMVFFNDPVPVADASERAVKMAVAMREAMAGLQAQWRRQGRRIGFGAGIARGYATLGQIGFADRIDYTAIGTVCNLAARLCAEAKDGQILLSQRVAAAVEDSMPLDAMGDVTLKGLREPVAVYSVPLPAIPPHPSISPTGGEG